MSSTPSPVPPKRAAKALPSLPEAPASPRSPRSPRSPLPSPRGAAPRPRGWARAAGTAIARYQFDGDDEVRLALSPGDELELQERGFGWYKGRNLSSDCVGIFPASFVLVRSADYRETDEVPDANAPLVLRCAQLLLDWGALMRRWLAESKFEPAHVLMTHIQTLIKARADILSPKVGADGRKAAKKRIRATIARCTTELKLSFPVQSNGVFADDLNTNVLDVYRLYRDVDVKYKPRGKDPLGIVSSTSAAATSGASAPAGGSHAGGGGSSSAPNLVQVFIKFNAFICKVDEENDSAVELLFSLYSVSKRIDITEAYVVRLTNKLMVEDLERIDMQKTIFANVELDDTLLVCRVVRMGKLVARQKAAARHRIPFGIASVPISSVLDETNKRCEKQLPIFLQQGKSFQWLLENLKGLQPAGGGVALEIKVYNTPDLDSLQDEVKDFDQISFTNMLDMDSSNLKPGVTRNDFYLCIERGEMQQDGKKTAKNVEITMSVRRPDGTIVSGCLSSGVGEPPADEYHTCVFYHDNAPTWTETVRINMDVELFAVCHLFFEARHCTTKDEKKGKLFSVGSLPLVGENGTVIDNSTRQIMLYKPNPKPKSLTYYLDPEDGQLKASKEFLWVAPKLASTKLIQNPVLFKLLNWEKHEGALSESLKKLGYVDRLELVKVLGDLFPALFAMMETRSDLRMPIFEAISYLLSLLVAGRFDAFAPIVDEYFDEHFRNPHVYHHILTSLSSYFKNLSTSDHKGGTALDALKGLQYWFKILAKSKRSEEMIGIQNPDPTQFSRELLRLIMSCLDIFKSNDRSILGAQVLVLKSFDELLFSSVGPFFKDSQLANVILTLLSSTQWSTPNFNLEKLEMIRRLLAGPLFASSFREGVRLACLPAIMTEVQKYSLSPTKTVAESNKILEILCMLFNVVQGMMRENELADDKKKVMPYAAECATFIPTIVEAVESDEAGDTATLTFLTLFSLLSRDVLLEFLAGQPRSKLKETIHSILRAFQKLLDESALPKNWFSVIVFQMKTTVKTLQVLRSALMVRIQSFPKEIPVWTSYFELLFSVMLLPQLQLESLDDATRQLMARRYGDLRVEAGMVLRKSWNELRTLQSIFVPKFVHYFLSLVLLKQAELREIGMDMYWGVLLREMQETSSFKVMSAATIDNLDDLVSNSDSATIDFAEFETFFTESLEERLDMVEDDTKTLATGKKFMTELISLLALLREIKTLPPGAEYEEERILHTMQLMTYLRTTDRQATYIRYVQQLAEMLRESGSFVEAGSTLMLYGSSLSWDDNVTAEEGGTFPAESEGSRKERIYQHVIDLYASAQQWERALPLMRELRVRYETVTFQFDKLGQLLQREGGFFLQIVNTPRFYANYFRVGFYGRGFNDTVRNKMFIYKGLELESLTDFTARLHMVYRKAEILKTTDVSDEVKNGDGQFMLVTAVTPSTKEECGGKKRVFDPRLPANARKYLESNDVSYFVYSKPFKGECVAKGDVSAQVKEFAGLWVRKFFMVTGEPFPSYHKRLQVVEQLEIEISPIQNAVADIDAKNQSLIQLTAHAKRDRDQLGPLSMLLNGIIDAAVNGGTKIYTQLFLAPAYAEGRPADAALCERLRSMLVEQVSMVETGLELHRTLCPPSLLGLQEKMENFFGVLEKEMEPYGYVIPERKPARSSTMAGAGLAVGESGEAPTATAGSATSTPKVQTRRQSHSFSGGFNDKSASSPSVPSAKKQFVVPRSGTIAAGNLSPRNTDVSSPKIPTVRRQKSAGNIRDEAPTLRKKTTGFMTLRKSKQNVKDDK